MILLIFHGDDCIMSLGDAVAVPQVGSEVYINDEGLRRYVVIRVIFSYSNTSRHDQNRPKSWMEKLEVHVEPAEAPE